MNCKRILSCVAIVALAFASQPALGQEPLAFSFGYSVGYQNSFRNRLPVPPYFSVYPPVYYGQRFERPYGDSPYASFPQLRSAPNYYPVPKDAPAVSTSSIVNPHAEPSNFKIQSAPVTVILPRQDRIVEMINPFASDLIAQKQ